MPEQLSPSIGASELEAIRRLEGALAELDRAQREGATVVRIFELRDILMGRRATRKAAA